MSPFTRFVSRRLLGTTAVFAVLAASLAGFLLAPGTASALGPAGQAQVVTAASTAASATDARTARDPAGRARLRADLRAAFRLEGDARRSALAAIRAKALAGDYGKAIQRRAERRDIRHDLLVSLLPENLQQDLQALRLAPADQRPQLRAAIIDKALAGEYGADVQKAAERLKALHQG
jgi:hypothetical protein